MVVELVPIKGGIGSIFHPPRFGKDYKWYIFVVFFLPIGWLYATYHLLPEPEKSVDWKIWGEDSSILLGGSSQDL